MALQIALDDTQSEIGAAVPAAYVRIVLYTHDVKNDLIQVALDFHYNQAARNAGRRPIKGAGYQTTENAVNVFTGGMQARIYSWLKTLPEFAGAVDV